MLPALPKQKTETRYFSLDRATLLLYNAKNAANTWRGPKMLASLAVAASAEFETGATALRIGDNSLLTLYDFMSAP